jgi:hypothetical protein
MTSVGVKYREIIRLPSPYPSDCIDTLPDDYAPYANVSYYYSELQCMAACTDKYLNDECGCVDGVSAMVRGGTALMPS